MIDELEEDQSGGLIGWSGGGMRLSDRPGQFKHAVRVNWEYVAVATVYKVFKSHRLRIFFLLHLTTWGHETQLRAIIKVLNVEAAACSFGADQCQLWWQSKMTAREPTPITEAQSMFQRNGLLYEKTLSSEDFCLRTGDNRVSCLL